MKKPITVRDSKRRVVQPVQTAKGKQTKKSERDDYKSLIALLAAITITTGN